MIQSRRLLAGIGLSCALLSFSSCKPQSAATEQAAIELEELELEDIPSYFTQAFLGESEEMQAVIDLLNAFKASGDVNTHNDNGFSLLHLATLFHKNELVRCLLLDGADPKAQTHIQIEGQEDIHDTVFHFASINIPEDMPDSEVIELFNLLIQHGADINAKAEHYDRPIDLVGMQSDREELFLHLLELSPQSIEDQKLPHGQIRSLLRYPAYHAWPKSLEILLQKGAQTTTSDPLLCYVMGSPQPWSPRYEQCTEMLLKHGADINQVDSLGRSPFFVLTHVLVEQRQDDFDELGMVEKIHFLLKNGADPYQRASQDVTYPDFCAYDFMRMRPSILQALKELGHDLTPPVLELPQDDLGLLASLCRAKQTDLDAQAFAPYFDRLCSVLSTSKEVSEHELYESAVKAALFYMYALDADKAQSYLSQLPAWYAERDWAHLDAQIHALIHAVEDLPQYVVESKILTHLAEKLDDAGAHHHAKDILSMLSRCPDASQAIEPYLNSPRIELQLGALMAQLQLHDLPSPSNGSVESWLTKHNAKANTKALQQALLLTSQERLWFGAMTEEEVDAFLQAIEDIQAHKALAQYKRIIEHLDNPAQLDAIMSEDDGWASELDAAIARFIWQHRQDFFNAKTP